MQRNQLRPAGSLDRVPDPKVAEMAARFEPPDPTRFSWERHTIVVENAATPLTQAFCDSLASNWTEPLPITPVVPNEVREADRLATLTSIIHHLDILLRKLISLRLAEEKTLRPATLSTIASVFNHTRKELLDALRRYQQTHNSVNSAHDDQVVACILQRSETDGGSASSLKPYFWSVLRPHCQKRGCNVTKFVETNMSMLLFRLKFHLLLG